MSYINESIQSDTGTVYILEQIKRNEDLVPDEFTFIQPFDEQKDSAWNNLQIKEKFFAVYEKGHGISETDFITIKNNPNFYPGIILLTSILLISLGKFLFVKSFTQLYETLISYTKFRFWLREQSSQLRGLFFLTIPAYFLLLPLMADVLSSKSDSGSWYEFSLYRYSIFFAGISLFYIIRYFLMKSASYIFQTRLSTSELLRNISIYNTLMLFILIIFLPFIIYMNFDFLHKVVFFLFIAVEVVRIVRSFFSAIKINQYNAYYFFLYLCGVEIMPFLIILKIWFYFLCPISNNVVNII